MKRIVLFISSLQKGGSERVMVNLAEYFHDRKYDVILVTQYQKEMEGVYSTCVTEKTLDESPMAYKKLEDILNAVQQTVDVVEIMKPMYNFKAE